MMQRRDIARHKMFSVPHLIIIFLVALIVFGPEKLPDLARRLGKATAEFKRATEKLRAGFEEQMRELEREAKIAEIKQQPAENTIRAPRDEPGATSEANSVAEPPSKDASAGETAIQNSESDPEILPTEVTAEKTRDGDAKPA